jgi:hypothetical protein
MAYEESIRSITLKADTSLDSPTGVPGQGGATPVSGFQYRFVKVTGAATVGLQTDDESPLTVGVLQNKPQVVDAAATVAIRGVSMVEAGAAFSAGDKITSDGDGRAIVIKDASSVVLGIALQAATDDLQLIPVLLRVN